MTNQVNQAFEAWYEYSEQAKQNNVSRYAITKEAWQAATKASEQRIQELELTVKKWQENSVDLEYKCLDKNLQIAELQASNNKLREALEIARKEYGGLPHSLGYEFTHLPIINKALSSTHAQSLAEHDNATIDRCKNIVADDALAITFQSMGAYRSEIIRQLGELKATS